MTPDTRSWFARHKGALVSLGLLLAVTVIAVLAALHGPSNGTPAPTPMPTSPTRPPEPTTPAPTNPTSTDPTLAPTPAFSVAITTGSG
ncbi:hypothetical protein [Streptomyces lydicus]|uniref:hypothetical protein n=1 Tax=Streptomyces lydicus TaxID=47763 RepID=UPI0037A688F8